MRNELNQIYCFIIFIVVGIIISILFDIFRILRKVFKTPDFITYIEDIIFGVFSGIIIIYSIFIFNNGEIRLYLFLGILLGILSYLCTLSKLFIKFGDKIFTFFKKILLFPINLTNYISTYFPHFQRVAVCRYRELLRFRVFHLCSTHRSPPDQN